MQVGSLHGGFQSADFTFAAPEIPDSQIREQGKYVLLRYFGGVFLDDCQLEIIPFGEIRTEIITAKGYYQVGLIFMRVPFTINQLKY